MTQLEQAPTNPLRKIWKDYLEPFVFAIVITQFVVTLVGVDGNSMLPNLRDGERVFIPKYEIWLRKAGVLPFQRGEILVFKPPKEAAQRVPRLNRSFMGAYTYRPFLIKRLIGLPGDTISIQNGEVSINGKLLDSSWTTSYWNKQGCWDTGSEIANNITSARGGVLPDQAEITVPEGHFFVMGDNRSMNGSEDSRMFGVVPMNDIAGRAAAVIWPIMRKTELGYDCNMEQAKEPQGEQKLNWRLLTPDQAFQNIPAPTKAPPAKVPAPAQP